MQLTEDQVQQFRSDGFTLAPGFFSEVEVAAMRRQVEQWRTAGLLRNVATAGDGETHTDDVANLQLVPLFPHGELFRALPFQPKVIAAVTDLIGSPACRILDQLFYKPPRVGGPTNWHTDNAYFRISDPLKGTAMWIALHDASRENGTLKVIPRQFHIKHPHDRDPDSDHHIRMKADDDDAVHCELKAGGVVFFCYGTPHATGANVTDEARCGVGIHFLNTEIGPDHLTQGSRSKGNAHITGPLADNGMSEFGRDMQGVWDEEVARLSVM
ncbi:MAG: phytanoyl-CoA dioxygenase family protein [Pseudomonadota bacterium]